MNKKRIKRILLILMVLIILLLILISSLLSEEKQKEEPSEITTIEELLSYYHCTNIKIQNSQAEEFETDIYLTFGEDALVNGYSNDIYYKEIANYLTKLLQYQSYRIIDNSRDLIVTVIANRKEQTIEAMYINGEEDYFSKELTRRQIGTYQKTTITPMEIQAKELQNYIKENWQPEKVSLGTIESRFQDYDIYFDEGIEVKTIGGKVYNVVFTERYTNAVINNLKVNSSQEQIITALGEPTFKEINEAKVIGYKGEMCYVFFSENAISVYPRETNDQTESFIKFYKEFQANNDETEFLRNIIELWPDYNTYLYNDNIYYLEYALKGIAFQFNTSAENGIILYQNYEGSLEEGLTLETITQENLPEKIYLQLGVDLVFKNEIIRTSYQDYYSSEEKMSMVKDNDFLEEEYGETFRFTEQKSKLFNLEYTYVPEEGIRNLLFISKDRKYPNSQLIRHMQVNTYGWQDDEQFIYSVKNEGIYRYNAKTRELKALVTGDSVFEIKKIEGNVLFYDETSIRLD